LNILLMHPHDLYSSSEPWTVRIKNIACQFEAKGHSLKLVYFPLDKRDIGHSFLSDNIELIALDRRLGIFRLFRNILSVMRLSASCDIIHFQKCYYYVALPALIAAWIKNKPVHYDWDDWETKIFYYSNPSQFLVGGFINLFEKLVPMAVDTVSVSSGYLRQICLLRGVLNKNIFSAPVGANLEEFFPDPDSKGKVKGKYGINGQLVLYVGQLHGGQYAELFIAAAADILKENKRDIYFMIVGDGYRLNELKRIASDMGLGPRFIFSGFIPHEKVPSYINDADICVACFEDNAITRCKSPLKIAEYLACAKAIVASNVGEVRNMAGGVGVLTEPGNVSSLSEGIKSLLDNKALRDRLGHYARLRAERKYNWLVTADNILSAYTEAIRANGDCSGSIQLNGWRNMAYLEKTEHGFDLLTARVFSITSHAPAPYTIEVKLRKLIGERPDSLTVDPRCTFYKDDKVPKTINIVQPKDIIEVTYLVHNGIKVAFNIIVRPPKPF